LREIAVGNLENHDESAKKFPSWVTAVPEAEKKRAGRGSKKREAEEIRFHDISYYAEANALAFAVFYSGPLEEMHLGESSEFLKPGLQRITDDEIKHLMIDASQRMERFLREKEEDPSGYFAKIPALDMKYRERWDRLALPPEDHDESGNPQAGDRQAGCDSRRQEIRGRLLPETSYNDEANMLALLAFRNSSLEDLHHGKSTELLARPGLRRFTDAEMDKLMLESAKEMEKLLHDRERNQVRYFNKLIVASQFAKKWRQTGNTGMTTGTQTKQ